mmetsp:Transcript_109240/g.308132  ORF Transcript_109240/g.308132 Transcript_109240/m.308132 type:complete len:436 (-) Transcript_109240:217-1524(-)
MANTNGEAGWLEALAMLSAADLIDVRAASRALKVQSEHVAALLVSDMCRVATSSGPRASVEREGSETRPNCSSISRNLGILWLRALAQAHAPPRLILAGGGYNSMWNDHKAVTQPEDAEGCENSAEVVCSFAGPTISRRWRCALPTLNCHRADLALVRGDYSCTLFALGGRHGSRRHASVECLDLIQWKLTGEGWRFITPMEQERSGLVANIVKGQLVAAGGRGSQGVLREVEALALDGSSASSSGFPEWKRLDPMREPREYAACAVLDEAFWVLGGGAQVQGCRSVEVLDVGRGSWQPGPPMTVARYGAGAAAHAGRIFVAGGSSRWGQRQFTTLETLDPREGKWVLQSFPAQRGPGFWTSLWGCGVVAHDPYLFLCGGTFREAEESQDTVFVLDMRSMQLTTSAFCSDWRSTGHAGATLRLQVPRWCGGACLV